MSGIVGTYGWSYFIIIWHKCPEAESLKYHGLRTYCDCNHNGSVLPGLVEGLGFSSGTSDESWPRWRCDLGRWGMSFGVDLYQNLVIMLNFLPHSANKTEYDEVDMACFFRKWSGKMAGEWLSWLDMQKYADILMEKSRFLHKETNYKLLNCRGIWVLVSEFCHSNCPTSMKTRKPSSSGISLEPPADSSDISAMLNLLGFSLSFAHSMDWFEI